MSGSAASESVGSSVPVFRLPIERSPGSPHVEREPVHDDWLIPILRRNALWFCKLRWLVAATLTIIGAGALVPGFYAAVGLYIQPGWALGSAGAVAALNVFFSKLARQTGEGWDDSRAARRSLWVQIVADLLVLTAVIYGLGGGMVSVRFMYLFHIILACIVFPRKESFTVVALAATLQVGCLATVSAGIIPPPPQLLLSVDTPPILASRPLVVAETVSTLLIWLVIWYLASELVRRLRKRDRLLALANEKLEASLEERTAHMLKTTHELKAPFAAVHAQTQLVLGGYCGELSEPIRKVMEKIAARSQGVSRHVQSMLQLANLRSRGQEALRQIECDLATAVEATLARLEPSAQARGIRIRRRIRSVTTRAACDHVTMLLDNLIANAINYSYDNGVVDVTCLPNESNSAIVAVRDYGIGIPADKLPHVFDDYFRTDEAAEHNKASTGLGLAIVRQIATEAGMDIQVKSAPGWGSRFIATLPREVVGSSQRS